MLFEDRDRARMQPMTRGENKYAFFDEVALPRFEPYRSYVNDWLSLMPENARLDAEAQLRSPLNWQYDAGIAELMIFRALVGLGHDVEVHPDVNGLNPDFLVRRADGSPAAYVEVTTTNPTAIEHGAKGLRNVFVDGLDKLDLPPGWAGGVGGVSAGRAAPSVKAFRKQIETWAKRETIGQNEPIYEDFTIGDWTVNFWLHPSKSPNFKPSRSVSFEYLGQREMSPSTSVRNALDRKGSRYGIEDVPFLVVVADGRDEVDEDVCMVLVDALFGDVQLVGTRSGVQEERAGNGYFGRIGEGRHTNVSAVLLMPDPEFLSLYNENRQPVLITNPNALNPLPPDILPVFRFEYDAKQERMTPRQGRPMLELLGLPAHCWW